MAEIIGGGGGGGKHGKKKAKKGAASIDMTPMVDMAFLLLTFFVLAATLAKPKAMEIIYPKEVDETDTTKTKLQDRLATTLLLGVNENEVFYYPGLFKPEETVLILTDFSKDGFRKVMLERNATVDSQVKQLKEKLFNKEIDEATYQEAYKQVVNADDAPFVIIKTVGGTKYKNVINGMDELNICNVRKRAIQDMAESEFIALRQKSSELGLKKK